jgi:hypothetical protein
MTMSERVIAKGLFIGRTDDGDRLYLDVLIRQLPTAPRQTVEHDTVDGGEELSIVGALYHGSRDVGGGQCIERARSVLAGGRVAPGADPADVRLIVDVWERWHLNAMRAGCAHVKAAEGVLSTRERLDNTPPCPITGYRWGSAWLYEPLPGSVVEELTAACRRVAAV